MLRALNLMGLLGRFVNLAEGDGMAVKIQTRRGIMRFIIRRDVPEILAIEAESFSDLMDELELVAYLRQREAIGKVYEIEERVVAYVMYKLRAQGHRRWIDVERLAVAQKYRRTGIGRFLLTYLCSKVGERRPLLEIYVREDNDPGIAFLAACGLRANLVRGPRDEVDELRFVWEWKKSEERGGRSVEG